MTPADFRAWRSAMGYTWDAAALALGMRVRSVKRYAVEDRTRQDFRPVPGVVENLCKALAYIRRLESQK